MSCGTSAAAPRLLPPEAAASPVLPISASEGGRSPGPRAFASLGRQRRVRPTLINEAGERTSQP